jgi:hypothetical protein
MQRAEQSRTVLLVNDSMKRFLLIVLIGLVSCTSPRALAQSAELMDTPAEVATVTMCELSEFPTKYAGKMVQVKATAMGRDFSELWIEGYGCKPAQGYMHVLAVLPQRVNPQPDFTAVEDDSFVTFRSSIKSKMVQATFIGLFQPVFVWHDQKRERVGSGDGFGKKKNYDARLVIRSISAVTALPLMPH